MILAIILIAAFFGAPALAIYTVYKRTQYTNPKIGGYVYNGKDWVTWLWLCCVIAALFLGFIMPLPFISEQPKYVPDWNGVKILLVATLFYVCYAVMAFVPATAETVKKYKAAGKTVFGSLRATSSSMFASLFAALGTVLASIPSMVSNALNPTLAVKTVGNTVYKIIGTGYSHTIAGIIGLALFGILAFALIMFASYFFAAIGTIALGVIAVVRFVKNNKKKK